LEEYVSKGLSGIKSGLGYKQVDAKNIQIFKELYDKLWKLIKSELKSADKVFISPDGILNLLPFGAFIGNEEKFLLENMEIAHLTNGRELIGVEGEEFKPKGEMLLVANPEYNLKFASTPTTETSLRSLDLQVIFSCFLEPRRRQMRFRPC
jgi:hypothetical protein